MITILGPTASGKTKLAVHVAASMNGEVISADSRQVYKEMDIGTGKDLNEYRFAGIDIPYHLIDIADPGYEYSVFEFQRDFFEAYHYIHSRNKLPVLCGGSGLYLESVLLGYKLPEVPENTNLRNSLQNKSNKELEIMLSELKSLHNITDTSDRERLVRAIEIATFQNNPERVISHPEITDSMVFGIDIPREILKKRINARLEQRLHEGMIEEVQSLVQNGVSIEKLKYYGLEYKFVAMYIDGELPWRVMERKLNQAIHQFAKRQMTWFRRMERKGLKIHWLDGMTDHEINAGIIQDLYGR